MWCCPQTRINSYARFAFYLTPLRSLRVESQSVIRKTLLRSGRPFMQS